MARRGPARRTKTITAAARAKARGSRSSRDRPTFFATPADFRAWLAAHAATATELTVGFYKVGSGKPSITWPEAVDEALAFGWIDGIRRSLGTDAYTNRFTPRRPGSNWSAVNTAKAEALIASGRMTPAGLEAYQRRTDLKTAVYSYEQRRLAQFTPKEVATLRRNRPAWRFFEAQPPGYRTLMTYFVASARQGAARARRLARLIEASAAGRRLL